MASMVLVCDESSLSIDSFNVASCSAWQLLDVDQFAGSSITELPLADIALLTQSTIEIFVIAFVFKMLIRFLLTDSGRGG